MLSQNKIQIKILKAYLKGKHLHKVNIDGKILVVVDAYYGYAIKDSFLNLENLHEAKLSLENKRQIVDTGIIVANRSMQLLRQLRFVDDGSFIYIKEKYYKRFKGCTMFADYPLSPIFCYDNGSIFGVVLSERYMEREFRNVK